MQLTKLAVPFLAVSLQMAAIAAGQSTTGTISGRVVDAQGLPASGVTVRVASPNLQGELGAPTSENGDYIVTLLPPGAYTLTFELSGFERQQRTVNLSPTQAVLIDVVLGPAPVSETIEVVGRLTEALLRTAQVTTNFKQDLFAMLPTTRDLNAMLLLAPAVHPTAPGGLYSISGAMSFENLLMVNGVSINENLRGEVINLYIEDAIQETTVASAGISSDYGRFGGGVVNVVTKSGGNLFSGSFRDTLNNDDWRSLTPFAGDSKIDKVVPTYEYTLGGPVLRDRLWFFTAGRLQAQESSRQLVVTNLPYVFKEENRRFEGKASYSPTSGHRFQSAYTKIIQNQFNNTFGTALSMDLNSLEDRRVPENLFTITYSGILSPAFFVEGRYSARHRAFEGTGSKHTDLVRGTLLLDQQRNGLRYWSATFCGVCPAEKRDNEEIFVKGSSFLSTSDFGSHAMVFGYDRFNDKRFADNHQSGSDYRILGTTAIIQGTEITPQFLGDGSTLIQWDPIFASSIGTNFRTHSVFYNDTWRATPRLTANLGVRWDKNDGTDSTGTVVANDSTFSPRVAVIWDPAGNQRWSVTGSVAKYVAAISNPIANAASPGGNFDSYRFVYSGPSINADPSGPLISTPDAVQQLFDWFLVNDGTSRAITGTPTVRGVSPQIRDSLDSPHALEYSGGVSRQFGNRAAVRADVVYRHYSDFYVIRTDTTTGQIIDGRLSAPPAVRGRIYDLAVIGNDTGTLTRRYAGLTLQASYRFGSTLDIGGNYTPSRAWGNVDGENLTSGPIASEVPQYPEYKQASWNYPEGDLSIDQRHRARLWINYRVPWANRLALSLLQALESGVPYGAAPRSGVDPRPHVANPGYLTPPSGTQTPYFFTARDAFRTEGQRRTDFAAHYAYTIPGTRNLQLFGQLQVLNIFNQSQLCGCGDTVFGNGGGVRSDRIDQAVRTAVTTATLQPFNPFATEPVEGVHWSKGPNFGKALNRFAYTMPRTLRISFGVRF